MRLMWNTRRRKQVRVKGVMTFLSGILWEALFGRIRIFFTKKRNSQHQRNRLFQKVVFHFYLLIFFAPVQSPLPIILQRHGESGLFSKVHLLSSPSCSIFMAFELLLILLINSKWALYNHHELNFALNYGFFRFVLGAWKQFNCFLSNWWVLICRHCVW